MDRRKSNNHIEDPFTKLMFGERKGRRIEENGEKTLDQDSETFAFFQNEKIESLLQNIDIGEVMNHVETLMNSASELKPVFKKITPYMEQFLQKWKN